MLRATSTLSQVSIRVAGLSLECPAEDTPGLWYPMAETMLLWSNDIAWLEVSSDLSYSC